MQWENNHFIQKALAKNWANKNGEIKYIKGDEIEIKKFNINSDNGKHPISKKNFYSSDIEKGMNRIEGDGINVIRKIINNSNAKEVRLTRKEVVLLRFYISLSEVRTEKMRDNYKNNDGDSLFRKINEEDGRTPKEIQEYEIKKLIDWYNAEVNNEYDNSFYKEYKEKIWPEIHEFISQNKELNKEKLREHEWKTATIEKMTLLNLSKILMHSKISIIRFRSSNLLLMEANSFCEYYPDNKEFICPKMYDFFPISPSLAIVFYDVDMPAHFSGYKSKIFTNNLSDINHLTIYINQEKILKDVNEIYKNNDCELAKSLERHIIFKHRDDKDIYVYPYIDESKEVAAICNGMMMVHNKNHIIIFSDKKDVSEAKKMIEIRGICRIEDIV